MTTEAPVQWPGERTGVVPGTQGLQALAAATASASVLLTILWLGGSWEGAWSAVVVMAWSGLAVVTVGALRLQVPLRLPWLLIPALGFGAEAALQWGLGWSVYPGATLTGWLQLSGGAAILYLAWYGFQRRRHVHWLYRGAWGFGGLLASEAILQFFTARGQIYWERDASYGSPVGPFVYHNHFAGCIEMLLPLAAYGAIAMVKERPVSDLLTSLRAASVPILMVASLVLSGSRGGVLVLGLEVLAGWAVVRSIAPAAARLGAWLIGGVLAASVLLVSWHPLLIRVEGLAFRDPSALARLASIKACWHIFLAYPWLGSGFNTFASVYPRFRVVDDGLRWTVAHCDWLQMLAEMGLVGAGWTAAFLVLSVRDIRRALRRATGSVQGVQWASTLGAAALLLHAAGDFQFHSPANAYLFFYLVGVAAAPVAATGAHRRSGAETAPGVGGRGRPTRPAIPSRERI